jgi:hypothetical protein
MTAALTVDEALGPNLEQVILDALASASRSARSAVCPVCGGTMRRLADAAAVSAVHSLTCGECFSTLEDSAPEAQLRLVA